MEPDVAADVGSWVVEFLLRLQVDDPVLEVLASVLPLSNTSNNNSNLKKSILLRSLESEISQQPVSETLLNLLEQIEELDFQAGITEPSGSMKAAYLAVAVACTVRFLSNSGANSEYFHAVNRIWKGKVSKLERAEGVGLISQELLSWKDNIETAIWNDSARDIVLKRSEGIDAIEAIRVYVKEEKGKMGPSFLESFAKALRGNEKLRVLVGKLGQLKEKGMNLPGEDRNAGPSCYDRELHLEESHTRADLGSQATPVVGGNLPPQNIGSKPSLMARDGTSPIFEDLSNERSRLQLPTPKRRVVSPLKLYESYNVTRRRQPKRWSPLEEATLRAGVEKFGKGNWMFILKAYRSVFGARTEVDLKDKWRNLTRYS